MRIHCVQAGTSGPGDDDVEPVPAVRRPGLDLVDPLLERGGHDLQLAAFVAVEALDGRAQDHDQSVDARKPPAVTRR
jgi:hypothetical protein